MVYVREGEVSQDVEAGKREIQYRTNVKGVASVTAMPLAPQSTRPNWG